MLKDGGLRGLISALLHCGQQSPETTPCPHEWLRGLPNKKFSVCFHRLVLYSSVLSHAFGILVHMTQPADSPRSVNLAKLLVPTLPAAQATPQQLQQRIKSTIRAQNQAAAVRAEAVAELERRRGTELVETVLREEGLLGRRKARSEVDTARALEELPKTREGFHKGDISPDNARILAGAKQRGTIKEEELVDDARTQSPDKFAHTVRKHEQQQSQDDGESKLEHQRSRRFAKITTDPDDGMTVLYGRFDPITGARIETAISSMMNHLWREEDPRNRATAPQRMADALTELITRQAKGGRPQDTKLLLIADYHTLSGQLGNPRLENGTPLPAQTLRKLACDAQILPAIFAGASIPLDLGRARRTATGPQRAALIARDKHCIGCGAKASWCQAHHIHHWQDGGPTNLDNMCLLCSRCHHKVHDQNWTVHKTPTGKYTLRRPPTDWTAPRRTPNNPYPRPNRRHPTKQRK